MFDVKGVLFAGMHYVRNHPGELLHSARRARHLRLAIPFAALKWLISELSTGSDGPRDVQISPSPPGIRVAATLEQMGTLLRGSCGLLVGNVSSQAESLTLEFRLKDVQIDLLDEGAQTPLAALIRSQTLDLSRVASLVAYLPSRPAALVEAVDDRLVFDLMKVPQLARNARVRALLRWVSGVLSVDSVCVDDSHIEVRFRPHLSGVKALISD